MNETYEPVEVISKIHVGGTIIVPTTCGTIIIPQCRYNHCFIMIITDHTSNRNLVPNSVFLVMIMLYNFGIP